MCPVCNTTTKLEKEKTAKDLKINYNLRVTVEESTDERFTENGSTKELGEEKVKCHNECGKLAQNECATCKIKICEMCWSKTHSIPAFKNHKKLALNFFGFVCPFHNIKTDNFCFVCSCFVCSSHCRFDESHKNHLFVPLSQAYLVFNDHISFVVQSIHSLKNLIANRQNEMSSSSQVYQNVKFIFFIFFFNLSFFFFFFFKFFQIINRN